MRISRLNGAKKFGISVAMTGIIVLSFGMVTVFAEETAGTIQTTVSQSAMWEGTGDEWRVKDGNGGYLKNAWFQDDVTQHWYMLGAGEDGTLMYSGLVTDQSTGKTYLMNTQHDGTYGRLISVDGAYTINGQTVYLTFNQNHDGSYGAITSGLSEARNTGVKETSFDQISTGSNGGTQTGTGEFAEGWRNKPVSEMTKDEVRALINERQGTTSGVDGIDTKGGTIDDSRLGGQNSGSNSTAGSTGSTPPPVRTLHSSGTGDNAPTLKN